MDKNKKIQKQKKSAFDKKNILKAIKLLKKLSLDTKNNSKDLFELSKQPFLYLNFLVNKLPEVEKKGIRQIKLQNGIYGKNYNSKFLFILSNELFDNNEEELEDIENWTFIKYEDLKKNNTEYKDKRELLKSYDLFFCERRISPLLKSVLGKNFYLKKKFPFPVFLDDIVEEKKINLEKLQNELENLSSFSTYLHIGNGAEFSMKIARMENSKDLDNLKNVLFGIKNVFGLFKEYGVSKNNFRRIFLKGESTESLPIYSYLSPEEKRVARLISKQ